MSSFTLNSETVMRNCIEEIKRSAGKVVTISKKGRSLQSNSFYWSILDIIAKDIGEIREDLHDSIKLRVLGPRNICIRGEVIQIPKRSSDLTQEDFSKLIEAAQMLAMSLNIILPLPPYYGESNV